MNYCTSIIAVCGVSIVMLTVSADDTEAQSRAAVCRSLNSQLSSLSSSGGGGNSAQYRKYNNAVRSQESQIKKTKRIAKRGRCTGLGFLNSRSAQCKRVISSLKKMEANLRSLKKTRAKHAPRQANSSRKRQTILRRIKQNRCNVKVTTTTRQAKVEQPQESKRKKLLEQIFGVETYSEKGKRKASTGNNNTRIRVANVNTYRTLCVRKTDGYYFPISFSTIKDRFADDEQTCQAMCPSAEVSLYHHKMPSEDSEEMISYNTGKPYASESFAFAYRKTVDLEHKCRFATQNPTLGFEQAASKTAKKQKSKRIGTPVFREDPSLPPDDHDINNGTITLAKARGYLIESTTDGETQENQLLAENKKIRIVGPAFFPVQ